MTSTAEIGAFITLWCVHNGEEEARMRVRRNGDEEAQTGSNSHATRRTVGRANSVEIPTMSSQSAISTFAVSTASETNDSLDLADPEAYSHPYGEYGASQLDQSMLNRVAARWSLRASQDSCEAEVVVEDPSAGVAVVADQDGSLAREMATLANVDQEVLGYLAGEVAIQLGISRDDARELTGRAVAVPI